MSLEEAVKNLEVQLRKATSWYQFSARSKAMEAFEELTARYEPDWKAETANSIGSFVENSEDVGLTMKLMEYLSTHNTGVFLKREVPALADSFSDIAGSSKYVSSIVDMLKAKKSTPKDSLSYLRNHSTRVVSGIIDVLKTEQFKSEDAKVQSFLSSLRHLSRTIDLEPWVGLMKKYSDKQGFAEGLASGLNAVASACSGEERDKLLEKLYSVYDSDEGSVAVTGFNYYKTKNLTAGVGSFMAATKNGPFTQGLVNIAEELKEASQHYSCGDASIFALEGTVEFVEQVKKSTKREDWAFFAAETLEKLFRNAIVTIRLSERVEVPEGAEQPNDEYTRNVQAVRSIGCNLESVSGKLGIQSASLVRILSDVHYSTNLQRTKEITNSLWNICPAVYGKDGYWVNPESSAQFGQFFSVVQKYSDADNHDMAVKFSKLAGELASRLSNYNQDFKQFLDIGVDYYGHDESLLQVAQSAIRLTYKERKSPGAIHEPKCKAKANAYLKLCKVLGPMESSVYTMLESIFSGEELKLDESKHPEYVVELTKNKEKADETSHNYFIPVAAAIAGISDEDYSQVKETADQYQPLLDLAFGIARNNRDESGANYTPAFYSGLIEVLATDPDKVGNWATTIVDGFGNNDIDDNLMREAA